MSEEEIDIDKYDNELLRSLDKLKFRYKFLVERNKELELENKNLQEMYEKRVNEYLELKKKVGDIE